MNPSWHCEASLSYPVSRVALVWTLQDTGIQPLSAFTFGHIQKAEKDTKLTGANYQRQLRTWEKTSKGEIEVAERLELVRCKGLKFISIILVKHLF